MNKPLNALAQSLYQIRYQIGDLRVHIRNKETQLKALLKMEQEYSDAIKSLENPTPCP